MKAMVLLALILLPLTAEADVIIPENEKQSRPAPQKPVKTDTTVTAPTTASTTTATTAATTTSGTTAATTSTTITETAALPVTQTTATQASPVPAPAPDRRRSTFPFAALFTIGIVLVAALSAKRRRERKAQ